MECFNYLVHTVSRVSTVFTNTLKCGNSFVPALGSLVMMKCCNTAMHSILDCLPVHLTKIHQNITLIKLLD